MNMLPRDVSRIATPLLPIPYTFERFGQIRVIWKNGEPWFVTVDVARVLEIKNVRNQISRGLDDDEKGSGLIDTLGGPQAV